jgi:hypothetical protein
MGWFGHHEQDAHNERNGANGGAAIAAVLDGTAALEADLGLARGIQLNGPSILLTYEGWVVGQIVHAETRVLDALTSSALMVKTKGETKVIERDEVILVVPPPMVEPNPMRVAKQALPVSVDIGVATLRGKIHVLPGQTPWETWQRSRSGFVALTDAVLDFPDGTSETADTVLVSRHAAHSGLLAS